MKSPVKHKSFRLNLLLCGVSFGVVSLLVMLGLPAQNAYAQQPTGSIPTVTGTPAGPYITVYSDQKIIEVYAGPGRYNYYQVGVLLAGESAPALGVSRDGDWIQIVYRGVIGGKGWVYAPLVSLSPGTLPKVDSPPTATPRTTPTIDPTLAAAFQVPLAAQLSTFTPPPPLQLPVFDAGGNEQTRIPMGLVILSLAIIGVFGAIIFFLRGV